MLAAADVPGQVQTAVGAVIAPLMRQYAIPGMAVGVILNRRIYLCDYGVASKASGTPVNARTLFEIGSISKTFNATLATYAQASGTLAFQDMASRYLPDLRGSAFDHITLIDLGTYTPGGLPLQVPGQINDNAQLMAWFKNWKPGYPPGTVRRYSNMSIGLFGLIAANSLKNDYGALIQNQLFPALGLSHSFIDLPGNELENYAQGYADDGSPVRMSENVLAAETYGFRTTVGDLTRFIAINMGLFPIAPAWQRAVTATHTGYDQLQAGGMVQDLAWEQYRLPVDLSRLLVGNSAQMLLNPNPVRGFIRPLPPQTDVLINKTGSTGGFGAYAVFVPAHHTGLVLLANRDYPIPARVTAAYQILARLDRTLLQR